MSLRFLLSRSTLLSLALVVACGDPPAVIDGGPDGATANPCGFQGLAWSLPSVGMVVGSTRDVALELTSDYSCGTIEITLTATTAGVVSGLPASVSFAQGQTTRAPLELTGAAEGTTRIIARGTDPSGRERSVELEVAVTAPTLPACSGEGSGSVTAGGSIAGSGGLAAARIAVPAGASRDDLYHVEPFAVSIACAPDQLPEGYVALGPAVSFTSTDAHRFAREIDLAIPIRLALLPSRANRGHVEVAYTGPSIGAPRIVSIASPWFEGSAGDGTFHFQSPRLGTYQAVVRSDAPTTRTRDFQFRGILGFSMGGSGSGRIGVANPDRFDFVAPLGGPTDWIYMLEYMRRYHLGGFCTEAQRVALGAEACAAASQEHAPPRQELYEHHQHFENWWYEDDYDGQGGTFDRREYIEIFRDLTAMFGNINTDRGTDATTPNVTPPGVPDTERMRSDAERCGAPVVIAPEDTPADRSSTPTTGFYDDEYNPEGQYPVITFCDGAELDTGRWNPAGDPYVPVEIAPSQNVITGYCPSGLYSSS